MRICHIVEAAGGGSGQVVLDLVQSNIDAGNAVTLIHSSNRVDPQFLQGLDNLNGRADIHSISMQRSVGIHDLLSAWKLYRKLKKTGPFEIIHSHSSKAGALARMAGLFLPRKSIQVYTPHAFMTMAPDALRIYGWIEWMLSWFGTAIICVSPQEQQHAREQLKIPQAKLHVIVNGVRLDYPATRSTARKSMGFGEQDFIVGFVGRLVPQKNPQRLITAFSMALKKNPGLRLAIVGDGPLQSEIEEAIVYNGIGQHVKFLGNQAGRDLMPGFDCLVASSDYESFGLVLLEAMAAGVPAISTPVGIAEEAITTDITGYVTSDFSAESLANAIVRLSSLSPTTRAEMSAEAKVQAASFSREGMAMKTMTLYKDLVMQRRA